MSQAKLEQLFDRTAAAGVYQFRGRAQPTAIRTLAAAHGWCAFCLDGRCIVDKASFLHQCATAMTFPAYFGNNWDALEECLTDLTWAPARGYLILYDDVDHFARDNPQDWVQALAIFRSAIVAWAAQGTPFVVLLRRTGGATPTIPQL